MLDKINGTKPVYSLITESKISKEQLDKILEMCTPIVNIEPDYPLLFGTRQPDYIDHCLNCRNNPKNNPNASGNCCCSLPSKNITY